jgi:hypothetical protein
MSVSHLRSIGLSLVLAVVVVVVHIHLLVPLYVHLFSPLLLAPLLLRPLHLTLIVILQNDTKHLKID